VVTARQLVPSIFILSILITAGLSPWSLIMAVLFAVIVVLYATLGLCISIRAAFDKGLRCGLWLAVAFPVLHVSYGIGYLKGILDFIILRKRDAFDPIALSLSR
jgi:hypothetical protein